jgi:hypothetical protein
LKSCQKKSEKLFAKRSNNVESQPELSRLILAAIIFYDAHTNLPSERVMVEVDEHSKVPLDSKSTLKAREASQTMMKVMESRKSFQQPFEGWKNYLNDSERKAIGLGFRINIRPI